MVMVFIKSQKSSQRSPLDLWGINKKPIFALIPEGFLSTYLNQSIMKTVKIFISHSWNYDNQRDKLVNLLDERKYFHWRDYSVPIDDPLHTNGTDKELRDKIAEQIRQSSIVIVLAGVYASHSKWIKKEIEIAKNYFSAPKPILAVEPWGSEKTSRYVKDEATEIVRWNTERIVKAIRDLT